MNTLNAQKLDIKKLKSLEQRFDDVMELIDITELKEKLIQVEHDFKNEPNEINKARVGIVYHEVALNLSFLSETEYTGYATKSYEHLSELYSSESTTKELLPFVASYRASALSLIASETNKLSLLSESFNLFAVVVKKYSDITYLPEFLRGSVAENLPWFFFSKRKFSKKDFSSIIKKAEQQADYANKKVLSFTYWAWAKQHQAKKYRQRALAYLDRAIELDPEYKAGREKAEELKRKLQK